MSEKRLIKLRDTYEAFLLDRKAQRFKPSTIRTYEDRLQTFINWCIEGNNATLPDLTPLLIKKYFVHLQEKGLASRTIHGIAICIQTFCNWLASEELVSESPMKKVKIPKADRKSVV